MVNPEERHYLAQRNPAELESVLLSASKSAAKIPGLLLEEKLAPRVTIRPVRALLEMYQRPVLLVALSRPAVAG